MTINVGPTRTYTTRQAAWNYAAANLDLCGYTLTFAVDDGTYTDDFTATQPLVGGNEATIIWEGDAGNILLCEIDAPTMCFGAAGGACFTVQGFTLLSGGGSCIAAGPGSRIVFGDMNFGQTDDNHIMAWGGGQVTGNGTTYDISGGASAHYKLDSWGMIIINPCTVNVGVSAFTYFLQAGTGWGDFKNITFQGAGAGTGSTGTRYVVDEGAVALVGGAGDGYFPGGYAGSVDASTYSVYL